MRHFLSTRAIARLTGGMAKPTPAALLIEAAGVPERPSPRGARAGGRAVPLCAVAHPAEEELASTVEPTADDQPQRIHAPPRSGRGGWTTTVRRAKKGAASRALPRCDSARGSGVAKTPDPHPSAPSAGTLYLNSPRLGNSRPTAGPVANSAFSGDGQHPWRPRRSMTACRAWTVRPPAPGPTRPRLTPMTETARLIRRRLRNVFRHFAHPSPTRSEKGSTPGPGDQEDGLWLQEPRNNSRPPATSTAGVDLYSAIHGIPG
jgi:hypothetical protein